MQPLAKTLIAFGVCLLLAGLLLLAFPSIPLFGRLPGDLRFQFKNVQVFFPFVSCLILSLVLTVVLNLFFFK